MIKMNQRSIIKMTAVLMCSSILLGGCGLPKLVIKNDSDQHTTVLKEDSDGRYASIEEKLEQIDELLDQYYYNEDEIDPKAMEDGIMKGYVEGLGEKYTTYYSAEEFKSIQESTSGEYEGIGMVVSQNMDTKVITVIQVFEKGPGYKAGLMAGDIICKVNDVDIVGEDVNLVVKEIKGEAGTPVTITIYRPDTDQYIDMTMNREHIEQPTISHEMMADNIGYIYISSFDEVTENQFSEAIEDLQKQGMEGLIIDLRDNPGGVLDTVCHMLDRILPAGKLLVYTVDKNDKKQELFSENDDTLDLPMAVVVNGNSASASEIFTAAMQDYEKAVIVGETTYGKGIVQIIIPLQDGSAVKMTTSRYYTPKGVCIHELGVAPDIEVSLDADQEDDEQLDAAIEAVKSKISQHNVNE